MKTLWQFTGYMLLWFITSVLVGWLPWDRLPVRFCGDLLWLLEQYTWVPVTWLLFSIIWALVCITQIEEEDSGKYFEEVVPRTPKDWLLYHHALLTCGAKEDYSLSSVDEEYSRLEQALKEHRVKAQRDEITLRIKAFKEVQNDTTPDR